MITLGSHVVDPPVVLAPMAGVTNRPFRALCREFGPGLVYVNEMVMANALVHGNARTQRMVSFDEGENPRSLQIYGSDPAVMGEAVARLIADDAVDHIDINFGCPAAKVTRRGGGAAVPLKKNLLRAILREAVSNAAPAGVPVTCKFRMGISDSLLTFLDTAAIAAEEGVAWVALHARTAEQHYAGEARWDAITALKKHVPDLQVLDGDAVGVLARVGHELLEIVGRELGIGNQRGARRHQLADGHEIPLRIVRQLFVESDVHHHRADVADQQREPVGRCLGDDLRGNDAVHARAVIDNDALADRLGQPV